MSIASEITALNNNLTAAKSAVTAKGGTVGDTGLAGLAAEIESIPSGGGGDDPGNWGLVYYWPETKLTVEHIDANNCTASVVDEDLLKKAIESMPYASQGQFNFDFNFQQGEGWMNWELSEEPMTTADLLNYGIEVTDFDEKTAEYAMIMIMGNIEIDKTVPVVKLQVQSEEEFLRLRDPGRVEESFEPLVPLGRIQKYMIGRAVTTLPNDFISPGNSGALEEIDTTYAQNVTTIGDYVFAAGGEGFNVTCNMDFPSVISIGTSFMENTHFAGVMNLPEVKTIGDNFGSFWLRLPSMPKVETIGKYFMAYSNIESVSFTSLCPKLKTLGQFAFANSQLRYLDLGWKNYMPDLQSIGTGLCHGCKYLNTVVMDAAMVGVLTADTDYTDISFGYHFPNANYPLYSFGVLLDELGTGTKAAVQAKFPEKNGPSTTGYRKWRYES